MHQRRFNPSCNFLRSWWVLVYWIVLPACALLTGKEPGLKHADSYRVVAPSTWKARDQGESDYAYQLPSGHLVTANSACNRDTHVALDLLTRHLLIGLRQVTYQEKGTLVVDGTEGQFSLVRATNEGVPFHLALFVLPKEGCIFDFSLVSPGPLAEGEVAEFKNYLKSFRYGKN